MGLIPVNEILHRLGIRYGMQVLLAEKNRREEITQDKIFCIFSHFWNMIMCIDNTGNSLDIVVR